MFRNCIHCDAFFQYEEAFQKHSQICLTRAKNHPAQEIDIQKLYQKFVQLEQKCDKMQKEINRLRSQSNQRLYKNKIELLNISVFPKIGFETWIRTFSVSQSHLEECFENDLMDGYKKCIVERITKEGVDSVPIRVLQNKELYIYTTISTTPTTQESRPESQVSNKGTWKLCSHEHLEQLLSYISHAFLLQFSIYETRLFTMGGTSSDDPMYEKIYYYITKFSGPHQNSKKNKDRYKMELKVLFTTQTSLFINPMSIDASHLRT